MGWEEAVDSFALGEFLPCQTVSLDPRVKIFAWNHRAEWEGAELKHNHQRSNVSTFRGEGGAGCGECVFEHG